MFFDKLLKIINKNSGIFTLLSVFLLNFYFNENQYIRKCDLNKIKSRQKYDY